MKTLQILTAKAMIVLTALIAIPFQGHSKEAAGCPNVMIATAITPPCGGGGYTSVIAFSNNDSLTYAWSGGTIVGPTKNSEIFAASSGVYSVTVTNGCGASASTTVIIAPISLIPYSTVVNDSTYEGRQGSACAHVSGGAAPYTYAWSTGDTSACISNLGVGNYMFTITDKNHCSVVSNTSISQPAPAPTSIVVTFNDSTATYRNVTPLDSLFSGQIANCLFNYNTVDSVTIKTASLFSPDTIAVSWQVFNGDTVTNILAKYYIQNTQSCVYDFELLLYCGNAIAKEAVTVKHGYLKAKEKYYVNANALGIAPIASSVASFVYPVPCSNQLTVHVATPSNYALTILDVTGKVVGISHMAESEYDKSISLVGLDKGIYFLKLQSLPTGSIEFHKVMKE